nr:globin [Haloglycomyces albus]
MATSDKAHSTGAQSATSSMPTNSPAQGTIPLRRATPSNTPGPEQSFYTLVGGSETFEKLSHAFYDRVKDEPLLIQYYDPNDLDGAARRLQLFLEQYWGGPHTYQEERGHPRLRMRHASFRIGIAERDAWLNCMRGAMDAVQLDPEHDRIMWDYMVRAADFLRNVQE